MLLYSCRFGFSSLVSNILTWLPFPFVYITDRLFKGVCKSSVNMWNPKAISEIILVLYRHQILKHNMTANFRLRVRDSNFTHKNTLTALNISIHWWNILDISVTVRLNLIRKFQTHYFLGNTQFQNIGSTLEVLKFPAQLATMRQSNSVEILWKFRSVVRKLSMKSSSI